MTIATNVCYFGCQLVNELVVPLHKILLLALWPPEKNRTGRTLLHLPAGRREPQLRHCVLLYYTVFTLDNQLLLVQPRLNNRLGELYTDELPWRATENEFPLFNPQDCVRVRRIRPEVQVLCLTQANQLTDHQ